MPSSSTGNGNHPKNTSGRIYNPGIMPPFRAAATSSPVMSLPKASIELKAIPSGPELFAGGGTNPCLMYAVLDLSVAVLTQLRFIAPQPCPGFRPSAHGLPSSPSMNQSKPAQLVSLLHAAFTALSVVFAMKRHCVATHLVWSIVLYWHALPWHGGGGGGPVEEVMQGLIPLTCLAPGLRSKSQQS